MALVVETHVDCELIVGHSAGVDQQAVKHSQLGTTLQTVTGRPPTVREGHLDELLHCGLTGEAEGRDSRQGDENIVCVDVGSAYNCEGVSGSRGVGLSWSSGCAD